MKKQFILCLLFIPFIVNAQHTIKGDVKKNTTNFTVYLKEFTNYNWIVLDSTVVNKNKFEFHIADNDKLIYIDTKDNPDFYIKLYNVKGTTNIKFDLANNTYSLKGTEKNEGLSKYEHFIKSYYQELDKLTKQKPKILNPSKFTPEEQEAYYKHFLLEKAVKNKIDVAKFKFIEQNKKNAYTKILIAEKLKSTFKEEDYDVLEKFYSDLELMDKDSENGQKLASFLKEYKNVKIGAKVADFSLTDVNETKQTLYKNLEKYTIIDFWASWCAPCRKENPNVVALYNKYKDKGLNIIGISLDNDKQKWINAIEKDQLSWLQLSDLKGWNEPLLQTFKITSIPKTIILDKNGVIIAKDLRGDELENKLKELFK